MKTYSPFWALMTYFVAVLVFDFDQTAREHEQKLATMQEYGHWRALRPQADAEMAAFTGLRDDLLRLAPGDPQASQIVEDLHLRPSR